MGCRNSCPSYFNWAPRPLSAPQRDLTADGDLQHRQSTAGRAPVTRVTSYAIGTSCIPDAGMTAVGVALRKHTVAGVGQTG